MKKAINLRLDENVVLMLNELSKELNTTKTEIVEKAIKLFSYNKQQEKNNLLKFAGILKEKEANALLQSLKDKKNKEFNL